MDVRKKEGEAAVVCLWLALLIWFSNVQSAAEREPQDQRMQKSRNAIMLGKLIEEATTLPNDCSGIIADYDGGDGRELPLKRIQKFRTTPINCIALLGQRCLLAGSNIDNSWGRTVDYGVHVFDIKTRQEKRVTSGHDLPITS